MSAKSTLNSFLPNPALSCPGWETTSSGERPRRVAVIYLVGEQAIARLRGLIVIEQLLGARRFVFLPKKRHGELWYIQRMKMARERQRQRGVAAVPGVALDQRRST
jgi:hypothetical protein